MSNHVLDVYIVNALYKKWAKEIILFAHWRVWSDNVLLEDVQIIFAINPILGMDFRGV